MHRETIALHTGYEPDSNTKLITVPMYQTVAYGFDCSAHDAALFNLEVEGFRCGHISNSAVSVLEQSEAASEGGVGSLCVSSGQAELHYSLLNLVGPDSNIMAVRQPSGTTHTLFSHLLPRFGVTVRFAESDQAHDLGALIDTATKAVFCESVGNPASNICDVEAMANIAHLHGVRLVVDDTAATRIRLRPIEYGADIVVHSSTDSMRGHGGTVGGAIVDGGKYLMLNCPDPSCPGMVYSQHFGRTEYIARCRCFFQWVTGSVSSPFNPSRLACHPASTTHDQMPVEAQFKAGAKPEMIRLRVGTEHAEDLIADLNQALESS